MAENKTQPTDVPVETYLAAITDDTRRADCAVLVQLMSRVTGAPAVMWGDSIVGCGRYRYQYASGHKGEFPVCGFSSRKGDISVYLLACEGPQQALLATLGRHKIAPQVSPNKTWEGFIGGVVATIGLGTALWWATPFNPWQAAAMSALITLMGFGGGLVMSAIKRDRGVKDYGTLIEGHGGVMDRIDSICFAAPVFFHVIRYGFT